MGGRLGRGPGPTRPPQLVSWHGAPLASLSQTQSAPLSRRNSAAGVRMLGRHLGGQVEWRLGFWGSCVRRAGCAGGSRTRAGLHTQGRGAGPPLGEGTHRSHLRLVTHKRQDNPGPRVMSQRGHEDVLCGEGQRDREAGSRLPGPRPSSACVLAQGPWPLTASSLSLPEPSHADCAHSRTGLRGVPQAEPAAHTAERGRPGGRGQ